MKSVIWKVKIYAGYVNLLGIAEVIVPKGSVFMSVGNQRNTLCLWYMHDQGDDPQDMETRSLYIGVTGTGFDPKGKRFLGTVLLDEGNTVLHVWEIVE